MLNSSSMAMTTSTASRLSRPRSLVKLEFAATFHDERDQESDGDAV